MSTVTMRWTDHGWSL